MKQVLVLISIMICSSGFSQTIKGYVVDEENKPIIGAQVMESGHRNGTTSNIDGSFILTLNQPNSMVIFSFVGFQTDSVLLQHDKVTQVVLKGQEEGGALAYANWASDYRVYLIILWATICGWLGVRTFRGVASA
ncbi:MAG: carboxypeptidase-like regulatory domain-containing protein [Cyclobacteriaceae bacterium]